ncbi:Cation channel sperm-associated protein 2, partial [Geodia barretti]
MVFITILLFAVAYIFAIVGVVFFESYSIPDRPDLNYQHSFSSLPRALLTLFQLFTLDQWVDIHSDLVAVSNRAFTSTYILLWVWVGAFLFRNLFVGIMVNNFQTITADLFRRQECVEQSEELARMKEELDNEINKHDNRMHRPHLFPSVDSIQQATRCICLHLLTNIHTYS